MLFDQPDFPDSVPALELFFASDRFIDIVEDLVPNQHVNIVFLGEAFGHTIFVFLYAPSDIIRDPNV